MISFNKKPKLEVRHSRNIFIFLISLLIIGTLIRVFSGNVLFQSDLIYSSGKRDKPPGIKTPEATVKSFYMFIDKGYYGKAWEISLEPDWTGQQHSATYRDEVRENPSFFSGWTTKDYFVSRLNGSLGQRGGGISLNRIESFEAQKLLPQETTQIKNQYNQLNLEEVFIVRIKGQMLGACSIFRWNKDVVVLNIDGKYRVLLSGQKKKNSYFYQSWFSNLERLGNLRGDSS